MTEAGAELYDLGKSEGLILGKAEGLVLGKAEGLVLGKAEGLEEGRLEGIEKGSEMTLLKTIEAITFNLNISIERAIEVCNVSQADRDKILQQLKKNKS